MLNWFYSKKEELLPPLDFSVLKTDIHSHLIPGIDDGSNDMESTIELIKKLQNLGYRKLITTPHVMSDLYRNSSEIILQGLSDVRAELKFQSISMEIDVAAEYYIDFDFEKDICKGNLLTFGDNYILVELSFSQPPKNLFEIIFKLQLEGYRVVLAHPERYGYYTKSDYEDLTNRGVFFQINFLSLIGYYSASVQKNAELLINNNHVSFIGTDCHNISHAELYKRCQSTKSWHTLVESGRLLNAKL